LVKKTEMEVNLNRIEINQHLVNLEKR
jgi:hypothetical protein